MSSAPVRKLSRGNGVTVDCATVSGVNCASTVRLRHRHSTYLVTTATLSAGLRRLRVRCAVGGWLSEESDAFGDFRASPNCLLENLA